MNLLERKTEFCVQKPLANLPYLFEVTGPKVRFFLLGSQHDLPAELLPTGINELLSQSDILVKEVVDGVFGDAGDVPLKELALHGLVLEQEAEDWTKHFNTDAAHWFEENVKKCIEAAWNIEPHRISPVVVNHVVSDWGLSHSYGMGMDTFIEQQFEQEKKPVFALEDGNVRFNASDTLFALNDVHNQYSLKENVAVLESTMLSCASESTKTEPFVKKRDDFKEYFAESLLDKNNSLSARDLSKRNLSWINTIENYLTQHPDKMILFMFGYSHLAGAYGIVNLLKNLGYRVNKISCARTL